jgi:hypothetical protein
MTVTNKRLLISESHSDSNRCTPCRGNPDQHATYDSHASPRTPHVRFLWVVPVRGNLSWVIDRVEQAHCSREEGLPTQSTSRRWSIRGSVPSFSPEPANEAVGVKSSIYQWLTTMLTGPISPIYIGTFNTCPRGPTHWSLTDTGGDYNLGGTSFPRTTPRPSWPVVSPFHLRALPGLLFNQVLTTKPKCWVLKNLWPPRGLSTTRLSSVAYIYA